MRTAPKLALFIIGLVAIVVVTANFRFSSTPPHAPVKTPLTQNPENTGLLSVKGAGQYKAELDAFLTEQARLEVAAQAKAKADADAKALATWTANHRPVVVQELAVSAEGSTDIPPLLARIRSCESGNYTAVNRSGSTASGAYQILDSTWRGRNGVGGWRELTPGGINYARAKDAPPEIQDAVALAAFNAEGTAPWLASRPCWGK